MLLSPYITVSLHKRMCDGDREQPIRSLVRPQHGINKRPAHVRLESNLTYLHPLITCNQGLSEGPDLSSKNGVATLECSCVTCLRPEPLVLHYGEDLPLAQVRTNYSWTVIPKGWTIVW